MPSWTTAKKSTESRPCTIWHGPLSGRFFLSDNEIYNLEGQELWSLNSWTSVNATPIQRENCLKQYGLIEDIMNVLAARFNFTWSTDLEVSDAGGWGLWPKNDAGSVGHCHQQSGL